MKHIFMVALFVLLATPAHSDSFYKLIGYGCDKKTNAVVLTYSGAYNEAGEEMFK